MNGDKNATCPLGQLATILTAACFTNSEGLTAGPIGIIILLT
jgi:hypothetical protein